MGRTARTSAHRATNLARARKRTGLTQQKLDEQYRAALARNPQANASGGRTSIRKPLTLP